MEYPRTFVNRTIQHPGYEFFETDLSKYVEYANDQSSLIVGYSQHGSVGVPVRIDDLKTFRFFFGDPTNEAESYFYHGVEEVLDNGGYATVIRMPYENASLGKLRAFKYSLKTNNTGLARYKAPFKKAPSFKNLECVVDYIDESSLDEEPSDCDFIITNKFNFQPGKDRSDILVSVLGRANALVTQGFVPEPDVKVYEIGSFYGKSTTDLLRHESFEWSSQEDLKDFNNKLTRQIPQIKTVLEADENGFYNKWIKEDGSNQSIVVIVSVVKKSNLDGKFIIQPVEVFTGSLFKGAIDPITKESAYIGDEINNYSAYIGFYGKSKYKSFKEDVDELFVVDQLPYRIALTDPAMTAPVIIGKGRTVDDIVSNLDSYLRKLDNPLKFQFTDIFDCGLSSVIIYAEDDGSGDKYFNPNKADPTEKAQVDFLKSEDWIKVARTFARYCRYVNRLCFAWLDAPRKLTLNGQLTRDREIHQDFDDCILTPEKLNSISISEYHECCTEALWVKIDDSKLKKRHFIPSTIKMAGIINNINANAYPWTVPAGRNNARIKDIVDVSAILDLEAMDSLYKNRINYISLDSDGFCFEGNKTNWTEDLQINRINNRRLVNHLKRWTLGIGQQFIGEPNNTATRVAFKETLEPEFERAMILGALDSYSIDVGSDINSQLVITSGELRVKIIIKPVNCVEFVLANFVITRTGVNIDDFPVAW